MRDNQLLNDVPALLALIPLFAINPIATDVSLMLYPSEPATGATYLNVSPIKPTFVLADAAVFAKISEKYVAFATPFVMPSAAIPKAVIASVTISETEPKSSPDAAAKFITPSMPLSISFVFQPAIAMYSIASPASFAEKAVFSPISFALSVNFIN